MTAVVVALAVLLVIVLCKKIPVIGGKVYVGLAAAGVIVLAMTGSLAPHYWGAAIEDGLNRFLWIIIFCLLANFFGECQIRLGVIDKVMRLLKVIFGKSHIALLASTVTVMLILGAFVGSTSACIMVVGLFMAKPLHKMGLSVEEVGATLVMGATLGSLMPPVSFSFNTSASTLGVDVMPVLERGYIVAGLAFIIGLTYIVFVFGGRAKKRMAFQEYDFSQDEKESVGEILKDIGATCIPMLLLVVIIIAKNAFKIDLTAMTIGRLTAPLAGMRVFSAFNNFLVLTFFLMSCVSLLYRPCREHFAEAFVTCAKRSYMMWVVLLAAAFMVGAVFVTGRMDAIAAWAQGLSSTALVIGGAVVMALIGMLSGSDGTATSAIAPFLGPALMGNGFAAVPVAVAIGCWAVAGQGAPPADTCTFMVCGILSGLLGDDAKNINPVKVMFLTAPMWSFLFIAGFVSIYIF